MTLTQDVIRKGFDKIAYGTGPLDGPILAPRDEMPPAEFMEIADLLLANPTVEDLLANAHKEVDLDDALLTVFVNGFLLARAIYGDFEQPQ